eukprot:scaffold62468_cov45-Attheya_sp.AAC.5
MMNLPTGEVSALGAWFPMTNSSDENSLPFRGMQAEVVYASNSAVYTAAMTAAITGLEGYEWLTGFYAFAGYGTNACSQIRLSYGQCFPASSKTRDVLTAMFCSHDPRCRGLELCPVIGQRRNVIKPTFHFISKNLISNNTLQSFVRDWTLPVGRKYIGHMSV